MADFEISKKTRVEAASPQGPSVSREECSNPMLNKAVLQTLFENASFKEMKTYRQVCRLWWEASLPRWRRGVWVKLDNKSKPNGLDSYLDGSASSDPLQLEKHPFRKYKLNELKLGLVDDRQLEFWRKCGPNITHLEIPVSHFRSVRRFESILFEFVPNLEFLHIRRNTVAMFGLLVDASDSKDAPPHQSKANVLKELQLTGLFTCYPRLFVPWLRLLGQYPHIESLSIANYDFPSSSYSPGRELDEILNAMITFAREQGVSWKIGKLNLLNMGNLRRHTFESRHSELFQQLQLPLTTLSLHVGSVTTSAALKVMLETCAFTLRKLVVYREDDVTEISDEQVQGFPYGVQLDSLSELWLSGRLPCENLNFLPFTPNLTSLILAQDIGASLLAAGSHVSGDRTWKRISDVLPKGDRDGLVMVIQDTDFSRLEHLVCPNLNEFILSGKDELANGADEVAALYKLMPNLKTLMLGLDNDGFRAACAGWKDLEVLIILPYDVDQFGFTGNIPLFKYRLPNLSDLTRLRYFGMGFETNGRSKTELTDESVLNAIFPLENLQGITAVYDDSYKISVKVLDQLLSKFPGSKIKESGYYYPEWPREKAVDESNHDSDSEDYSSDRTEEENSQDN